MKKKILFLLLMAMAVSFAGCGEKIITEGENNFTDDQQNFADDEKDSLETQAEGALLVLQRIWAAYEEEEKFVAGGGDSHNMVMDEPGKFDMTNTAELNSTLGFPEESADSIDDAASLLHMMNANTFTSGVYHLTDKEKAEEIGAALKENILNRQWICGFPETLIILSIDEEYVLSAFGNDEQIQRFKQKTLETFDETAILYEESL